MKVGFIGFGGAGFGLASGLRDAGVAQIHFFDRMQETTPFAEVIARRATDIGARKAPSLAALLAETDLVISCVTGAMAVSVAQEAAPYLTSRHLYADVNTAAPRVKEEVAAVVEQAGTPFCDAAILGAVPTYLHRVPILASGSAARRFHDTMTPFGMNIGVIGEKPGQASAIKMFRSIFMKGLLSLFVETLTATHRYGVDETVLSSLAESLDGTPLLETARMQMTKGSVNAGRMAHEMEEVIATLEELGVPAEMSRASREKLLWFAGFGFRERFGGELPKTLAEVLAVMEGGPAPPSSAS